MVAAGSDAVETVSGATVLGMAQRTAEPSVTEARLYENCVPRVPSAFSVPMVADAPPLWAVDVPTVSRYWKTTPSTPSVITAWKVTPDPAAP